jgi:hypothetical protein
LQYLTDTITAYGIESVLQVKHQDTVALAFFLPDAVDDLFGCSGLTYPELEGFKELGEFFRLLA